MKKWIYLLIAQGCLTLHGSDTFSQERLVNFYDAFLCEEKADLADAGLTSSCTTMRRGMSAFPTPPPPTPPPDPAPPPSMSGLLPFVIVNNSGLPDSEVYILVQGRVPPAGPQVFVDFDTMTGVGTNHVVSLGDNGSTYTLPLSS